MNFIFSIDGPDASGKTLISQLVVEELRLRYKPKGYEVCAHRMPGGTPVGSEIRKVLKNPELRIAPLTERLLFAADASQFFYELLQQVNSCEKSIHVVDRWVPITEYMYCLPRGVSEQELANITGIYLNKMPTMMPDILFLVAVSIDQMLARLHADRRPACRIEQLGDDYHAKVWRMYDRAINDSESPAHKHCAKLAHKIGFLDNTRPEERTLRNVADSAISFISDHISERA